MQPGITKRNDVSLAIALKALGKIRRRFSQKLVANSCNFATVLLSRKSQLAFKNALT